MGGLSVPILTADEAEGLAMDYDGCAQAGTMLGSGGIIVLNDTVSIPVLAKRTIAFYAHESCGQCTPCRDGSEVLKQLVTASSAGYGALEDLDRILELCGNIKGLTICPTGHGLRAAARHHGPQKFRREFEALLPAPLASWGSLTMKLTINGIPCEAPEGATVLEAARAQGIYIPSLCHHPRTGPAAKCRACAVEIEGMRCPQTACTVPAKDGMVVRTDPEAMVAAQRMVIDLALSTGRHDCLVCERNGDCELQDGGLPPGHRAALLRPPGVRAPLDDSSEAILRDPDEVRALRALHLGLQRAGRCTRCSPSAARAEDTRVICDEDLPMGESTCVRCGECGQVCPTGALVFKPGIGKGRSWELKKTRTICPYCGVGCNLDVVATREGKLLYALGTEENWQELPNQGMLCVKGRFGLDFVNHPQRLATPLVRRDGELVAASWEEALDAAAAGLAAALKDHGPRAVGCLQLRQVHERRELRHDAVRPGRGDDQQPGPLRAALPRVHGGGAFAPPLSMPYIMRARPP